MPLVLPHIEAQVTSAPEGPENPTVHVWLVAEPILALSHIEEALTLVPPSLAWKGREVAVLPD